jgi:hypothetical protein
MLLLSAPGFYTGDSPKIAATERKCFFWEENIFFDHEVVT